MCQIVWIQNRPDILSGLILVKTVCNSYQQPTLDKELRNNKLNEPQHEISNIMVCANSNGLDQLVHMHSLIRAFASGLNIL